MCALNKKNLYPMYKESIYIYIAEQIKAAIKASKNDHLIAMIIFLTKVGVVLLLCFSLFYFA